jgi:endonuclease/exonuclease/phosphatase family metal-dependent hydrolase
MLTPKRWIAVGAVCSALAWSCGSDDDGGGDDGGVGAEDAGCDACAPPATALSLVTFNTGLLDAVGSVDERAPLVFEELGNAEQDVLCVQVVWAEEHWDALVAATAEVRPHVLRLPPMPGVEGQCTADEFEPLRACAELSCPSMEADELVACVTAMCDAVADLSGTCIACLLDNATGGLDVFEAACLGTGTGGTDDEPLPPEDRSYFLGGSFGLGLLSTLPFVETDTLVLDASTNRRGILYARLEVEALGEVSVFCTHLTPRLDPLRYEGSFGTWSGENEAHVQALIEWVDQKAGADGTVFVLGDLNTGPAGAGIEAELPDSYALLPAAGFAAPFLEGPEAACTFCSANPLVNPEDTGVDAVIDHVLTRNLDASVEVQRTLMTHIEESQPLSDHYGLRALVRP